MRPPYDEELIRAELDKLANATPAIGAICVSSTDIWTISSSTKPVPVDERSMVAITGIFGTLDTHMGSEHGLGGWQQMISISAGSEGLVINLPIREVCALILVVQPETALDDLFLTIEPFYQSLLKCF